MRRYPEKMRWLLIFAVVAAAASACAQTFNLTPQQIRQGETLKVTSSGEARSARMEGRIIKLFPQADGGTLGLMPVPVLTKPGEYTLEFLDEKGSILHSTPVVVKDAHFPKQNIVISKAIAALRPSPGEQETVGDFRKTVSATRYWKEPLQPPVPGCLTSPFGVQRWQNARPTGEFHAGVDQRGAAGTPIHPIASGVVKLARQYNLRGGTVAIDHGQGLESIYLHMSAFKAKEGDQINPEDVIGYIGSTGRSTGPHVHWTIYVNGEPVDPNQWMKLQPCSVAGSPAAPKRKRPGGPG